MVYIIIQEKNRKRGRNKISAKLRRKQKNVIDEQIMKAREAKEAKEKERQEKQVAKQTEELGALARFKK
jgi:hypothetical protein